MKKITRACLAIAAINIFLCLSYAFCEVKIIAPDFKLPDLKGNIITLSSYKDKQPVLLFFWTTRCPLCKKEIKILNNKYTDLTQDNLKVLYIDVGESPERVAKFIRDNYSAWPVLLNSDKSVAYAYEIIGVPTYVLINKKGYIVFMDNYFPFDGYNDFFYADNNIEK